MSVAIFLALSAILLVAISAGLSYRNFRQLRVRQQDALEQIASLEHKLELVNRGAMGVGKRLISVEKLLQSTRHQQELIEQEIYPQSFYNRAVEMFRAGESVDSVMESCQLSRAECLLIERIHQSAEQSA